MLNSHSGGFHLVSANLREEGDFIAVKLNDGFVFLKNFVVHAQRNGTRENAVAVPRIKINGKLVR